MYYLGVDGGGTKTTAILASADGNTIRTIKAGAANIVVLGGDNLRILLKKIVFELLEGVSVAEIAWATCAFAGAGRPQEKKLANAVISEIGIENFSLLTDGELLYYAFFGEDRGVLVAAGTGSICIVMDRNRQLRQIGGWGYLLGDEGSGFEIGKNAVREVLRELESDEPTSPFSQKLINFYQVGSKLDLVSSVYTASNKQKHVAASAKFVCDLASSGDSTAQQIVEAAADGLLKFVLSAITKLDAKPPYKLALAGGILQGKSSVLQALKLKAQSKKLNLHYVNPKLQPAAAAILHAIKQRNEEVSGRLMNRLQEIVFTG